MLSLALWVLSEHGFSVDTLEDMRHIRLWQCLVLWLLFVIIKHEQVINRLFNLLLKFRVFSLFSLLLALLLHLFLGLCLFCFSFLLLFLLLVDFLHSKNFKVLVPVVAYHLDNLLLGQESVLLSLLNVGEEAVHECIIVLVEYSHLIFGILMVRHLQDTLFVDHSLEDYGPFGVYIGGFLGLVGAF